MTTDHTQTVRVAAIAPGPQQVHHRKSMPDISPWRTLQRAASTLVSMCWSPRPSQLLLFLAISAAAQTPAFDVVSVKHVGDQQSNAVQTGPGSFRSNMRPFKYTPATVSCRTTMMSIL